jgi:hypothetical protein
MVCVEKTINVSFQLSADASQERIYKAARSCRRYTKECVESNLTSVQTDAGASSSDSEFLEHRRNESVINLPLSILQLQDRNKSSYYPFWRR